MDCVTCKEPMIVLELAQVEVDHCLACGGIWLDQGELELLLGSSRAASTFLQSFDPVRKTTETPRRCPICRQRMKPVHYGHQDAMIVEECTRRHGIWCDRGELRAMVSTAAADDNAQVRHVLHEMFAVTIEGGST